MMFPNRDKVKEIRNKYKEGARVELIHMNDPHAPPAGTHGTVKGVDDTGSIMVRWDNGSGLNVIYGEDTCRILDSVTVICYGGTDIWDSRDDAKAFYLEAMAACDGCERARYTSVYLDLMAGLEVCTDDE